MGPLCRVYIVFTCICYYVILICIITDLFTYLLTNNHTVYLYSQYRIEGLNG